MVSSEEDGKEAGAPDEFIWVKIEGRIRAADLPAVYDKMSYASFQTQPWPRPPEPQKAAASPKEDGG